MITDELVSTLYEGSTRTQNRKGLPVYDVNLTSAVEQGLTIDSIRTAAQSLGIRTKNYRDGLSFQTYNLRQTIKNTLSLAKQNQILAHK